MNKNWGILIALVLILGISFLIFYTKSNISPSVIKGEINLSEWNFDTDGNINLDGEWEFYWNTYLYTDSLQNPPINKDFIKVPGLWNKYTRSKNLPNSFGYASYKVLIHANPHQKLGLKIINAASTYEVFIDDKSYFKAGNPGYDKHTTTPSYKTGLIFFTPKHKTTELVIQVANFHHKKGGIWENVLIGSEDNIKTYNNRKIFLDIFFIGSILIIGIFHLIMFSKHTSDKSILYFAIFAILISIRLISSGQFTIYMLGNIKWPIVVLSDYLSFYLGILFFLYFLQSLFPKQVHKTPALIIKIAAIGFSITSVTLPLYLVTFSILYFQIFTLFAAVYAITIIKNAITHNQQEAHKFLYGFIILFITLINDILKLNTVIDSVNLASLGLIVFIMFQASILSTRARVALYRNEQLTKKLEKKNNELKKAKTKAEESDKFKSAFLANMSHEIRTPMNGIIGFSELLKDNDYSQDKKEEFITIINERSIQLLGIVNDIIDITKIETGQIEIYKSETSIRQLLNELLVSYAGLLNPKVTLNIINGHTTNTDTINTDSIKLKQILENLVSNATKFTQAGTINIGYNGNDELIEFFVKDTGIGISDKDKKNILDRFKQANDSISQNYGGTGLGLSIAKAYIEELGGKLWFESKEGVGTSFYFTLPTN